MMPPLCGVCGREGMRNGLSHELVRFADYEALPEGIVGHPKGLVWICEAHLAAAQALVHLPSDKALGELALALKPSLLQQLKRWTFRPGL